MLSQVLNPEIKIISGFIPKRFSDQKEIFRTARTFWVKISGVQKNLRGRQMPSSRLNSESIANREHELPIR